MRQAEGTQARNDTMADSGEAEERILGGDAHVAGQGELQATTDAGAVDATDDRFVVERLKRPHRVFPLAKPRGFDLIAGQALRSMPEQKPRPAPVTSTTRM